MPQIFISYSRKDLVFIEQLADDLKNYAFDIWYDLSNLEGGVRWNRIIEKAIMESQYVLVVLSPDSIKSEYVEDEVSFARKLKKKIIPLYYLPCELGMLYINLNYIDVEGGNYKRNFDKILRALNAQSAKEVAGSSGGNGIETNTKKIIPERNHVVGTEEPSLPKSDFPAWMRDKDGESKPVATISDLTVGLHGADEEQKELAPPVVNSDSPVWLGGERSKLLSQAKSELDRGDIPEALVHYGELIKKGRHLEKIIRDLSDALYRYPVEVTLWQRLGDAYMRANRMKEAMDCYNKAEELIR